MKLMYHNCKKILYSTKGNINRLMVYKSQMQLRAAKCGLENKFVSITLINHSQEIQYQTAKNRNISYDSP